MRKPKRKPKKRSKSVKLDKSFWIRNSKEVQLYRETLLLEQEGKCAVTGISIEDEVGALDHCHDLMNIRGVLHPSVNLLEGRYKSLFKKACIEKKCNITLPEFLISLGKYLQEDYSSNILHFKGMEDYRKKVKRWKKEKLLLHLKKHYGIILPDETLHEGLVQRVVQCWVDEIEDKLKEN